MSNSIVLRSAHSVAKKAYRNASLAYGTLGGLTTGLYLNMQRIAEKYVPGGVWNPEAWQQSWGRDGEIAGLSLVGTLVLGVATLTAIPVFASIYGKSNAETEIDTEERKITQISPTLFDKTGSFFEKNETSIYYDTILSVKVDQTSSQKKQNIGDLTLTTLRIDGGVDNYEGNSSCETNEMIIPDQEAPYEFRDRLMESMPGPIELKEMLREV